MISDDVVEVLRSRMYGDAELTTHQWNLMSEILCRQTHAVEDGERVWQVAGLQVDTATLQDAVRACQRRGGGPTDPAWVLGESDVDRRT